MLINIPNLTEMVTFQEITINKKIIVYNFWTLTYVSHNYCKIILVLSRKHSVYRVLYKEDKENLTVLNSQFKVT